MRKRCEFIMTFQHEEIGLTGRLYSKESSEISFRVDLRWLAQWGPEDSTFKGWQDVMPGKWTKWDYPQLLEIKDDAQAIAGAGEKYGLIMDGVIGIGYIRIRDSYDERGDTALVFLRENFDLIRCFVKGVSDQKGAA